MLEAWRTQTATATVAEGSSEGWFCASCAVFDDVRTSERGRGGTAGQPEGGAAAGGGARAPPAGRAARNAPTLALALHCSRCRCALRADRLLLRRRL